MTASVPSSRAVLAALGGHADELGQVLAVLRAAGVTEPEELPLGRGDRMLLGLVGTVTGADLELAVTCGACGTVNSAVLSPANVEGDAGDERDDRTVGVRPPTYADLRGLPAEPDAATAELLRRCTVGAPSPPPTAEDLDLVDGSLAGPLVLACTGCDRQVVAPVDIQQAALERLVGCAWELDYEVHVLAGAYRWDLAAIEGLPDERRRRLARFINAGR
ncbi:MAG: hypothetical protein ACR2KK_02780 [Acidimicrobiales bacterium]